MNSRKRRYYVLCFIFIFSFLIIGEKANAKSEQQIPAAKVTYYVNDVGGFSDSTLTYVLQSFTARVSPVSEFFDSTGNYNTIYESDNQITLVKYSKDFSTIKTTKITKPYPLYGGAITDSKGNYYIVYGQVNASSNVDKVVLSVVKYNSDLKYVTETQFTGRDTSIYSDIEFGTKIPFDAGNCDIALNGNILVCNYARKMYNGHQSNHVIFVNIDNMTKVDQAGCYTSHSFDQRVIVTKRGDYLFANQGDAIPRAFNISYSRRGSTNLWDTEDYASFHFREGANRYYGYNETFAELGGIHEIDTGYVLAGASEKTLSQDVAQTSREYWGYNEARNLFIQIINKSFMNLSREDAQVFKTPVRRLTGIKPYWEVETELKLNGNEEDYGVLWLTDYTDEYCVVNPKLVVTEDNRIVLLWEKFKNHTDSDREEYIDTYYMVLSNNGKVLQKETSLHGIRLTQYETPVYRNNKIYFTTLDNESKYLVLNELYIGETINLTDISTISYSKIANQKYTYDLIKPNVTIELKNKELIYGVDYNLEYKNNMNPGKAIITVKGIRDYTGEKDIYFYIKPDAPQMYSLEAFEGFLTFGTIRDAMYEVDGIEVVYSTDKDFNNKKVIKNKYAGSISNLKRKKTYYIKARTYIIVDGVKVYSNYSKVKKIKVK